MARTAVIAGTANATVGAMNRRQAGKQQAATEQQAAFEAQAQLAELQAQAAAQQAQAAAQQAPPPPPAPAPAAGDDLMVKLQQLADLKAAGVLDDAEFAAAKAKILS
jgi:hypothetical protein